jgi:hypothetical protein
MRPWIIAVLGGAGALMFALGSTWFDVLSTWFGPLSRWLGAILVLHADLASSILQYLLQLAPVMFAIYAAMVLLLTTATLRIKILRVRSRLEHVTSFTGSLWTSAFTASGLNHLAARILKIAPTGSARSSDMIIVERPFHVADARREIGHLYRDWLTRGQFFTALALFLGAATIGLAQKYGLIVLVGFTIPTLPIVIGALGLTFLSVCGRLVVYNASERLLDAIVHLPLEPLRHFPLEPLRHFDNGRVVFRAFKEFRAAIKLLMAKIEEFPAMTRVSASVETDRADLPVFNELQVAIELLTAKIEEFPTMTRASTSVNNDQIPLLQEFQVAIEKLTTQIQEIPPMVRASAAADSGILRSEPDLLPARSPRDDNISVELRRLLDDLQ